MKHATAITHATENVSVKPVVVGLALQSRSRTIRLGTERCGAALRRLMLRSWNAAMTGR